MATQEGAVDMDSNASRAGEVERKLWLDKHFFLQRSFLERRSPLSASPKRGQRRRCATDIGAAARQGGLDDAGYVAYCALRSRLVSAVRPRRIAPKRNMP